MKIALVQQPWNDCPLTKKGSISIWNYEIGRRLGQIDDVVVYTREISGKATEELAEGMLFRRISTDLDERLQWYRERLQQKGVLKGPLFASLFHYCCFAIGVAYDLRKQRCDIIHVHNLFQFVPIIKFFNPGAKIVLHMHCEWLSQLPRNHVKRLVKYSSLIVGCSEYITDKIRTRFPRLADRCRTVPNGVDTKDFQSVQTDMAKSKMPSFRTIVFVGRITPEKGLHVLLKAFTKVLELCPDVKLNIVGSEAVTPKEYIVDLSEKDDKKLTELEQFYSGSYLAQLKAAIPAHIAPNIIFTGSIPHKELTIQLHNADVLVNPSFSESFGMALIEAMACGLPVVATRVGGMTEIVEEGKTGLLVDSGDVEGLTAALLEMLQSDTKRESMGQAGRERVERLFTWDRITDNLRAMYRQLV